MVLRGVLTVPPSRYTVLSIGYEGLRCFDHCICDNIRMAITPIIAAPRNTTDGSPGINSMNEDRNFPENMDMESHARLRPLTRM